MPDFGHLRARSCPRRRLRLTVGALTAFCARRSFGLILGPEGSKGLGRRVPEFGRRTRSRRLVDVLACPRSALDFSERRAFRLIFGRQGSNNY